MDSVLSPGEMIMHTGFDEAGQIRDSDIRLVPRRVASDSLRRAIGSNWNRYDGLSVDYSLEPLCEMESVIHRVHEQRLKNAMTVLRYYCVNRVEPFLPITYTFNGTRHASVGIILERHGGQSVILDGLHRALASRLAGATYVWCAVVAATYAPPAVGPTRSLIDVVVTDDPAVRTPQFAGRGYADYRPGETFTSEANAAILSTLSNEENDHD